MPADALKKFLALKEPLDRKEREHLLTGCALYIECLLKTGDANEALKALKAGVGAAFPKQPSTLGKQPLKGMVNFGFEPYSVREYIPYATTVLFQRITEDGDRSVLPWVLQTLKYVYPAERSNTYAALERLLIDKEEMRAAVRDLLECLMAQKYDQELNRASLVEGIMQDLTNPTWTLLLAEEMAKFPPKALDPLSQGLMYRLEKPPRETKTVVPLPKDFVKLLGPEVHPTVVQVVCVLLWKLAIDPKPYVAAILSHLHDSAPVHLFETAAGYLSTGHATLTDVQCATLKAVRDRLTEGSPYARQRATEAVDALLANAQAPSPTAEPTITEGAGRTVVRCPFGVEGVALTGKGEALLVYRRILFEVPRSAWRNNEEEFGILEITGGKTAFYPIPTEFLSSPTGAAGSRRAVHMHGFLPETKELLLDLREPYMSDEGAWGTDNYLFTFQTERKKWSIWKKSESGEHLERTDVVSPLPTLCFGELKLTLDEKKHFRLEQDATPYHIDSYYGPPVLSPLPPLAGNPVLEPLPPYHTNPLDSKLEKYLEKEGLLSRIEGRHSFPDREILFLTNPTETLVVF